MLWNETLATPGTITVLWFSWRIIVGSAISMEIFTRQQLLLQREASMPRPAVLRRDYNRTARYPHNYSYSWNGSYCSLPNWMEWLVQHAPAQRWRWPQRHWTNSWSSQSGYFSFGFGIFSRSYGCLKFIIIKLYKNLWQFEGFGQCTRLQCRSNGGHWMPSFSDADFTQKDGRQRRL